MRCAASSTSSRAKPPRPLPTKRKQRRWAPNKAFPIKYIIAILIFAPQLLRAQCLSGDCNNGEGTYRFESGNTYSGHFVNRQREGQGTALYSNGDRFTGSWHANQRKQGTFTWSNGVSYPGSYDAQGNELDGTYSNGAMSIPVVAGVAQVPVRREAPLNAGTPGGGLREPAAAKVTVPCGERHGSGRKHTTIYGGGVAIDRQSNRITVFGEYSSCTACGGSGVAR